MKPQQLILFALLCIVFGCTPKEVEKERKAIPIESVTFPETIRVNETTPVYTLGYATDGCWYDLKLRLQTSSERHFLITGTGLHTGATVCPTVMVYTDTTFNITFSEAGKYYFQISEAPFAIVFDTIDVVN